MNRLHDLLNRKCRSYNLVSGQCLPTSSMLQQRHSIAYIQSWCSCIKQKPAFLLLNRMQLKRLLIGAVYCILSKKQCANDQLVLANLYNHVYSWVI